MANDYFQFKQFKILQSHAAMKVSTDACILGAAFAQFLQNNGSTPAKILDIGTGTGLLSLMLAQAFPYSLIDALEIDEAAIKDATLNFSKSPWHQQFCVVPNDLNNYETSKRYDAIICNPPFFNNHLLTSSSAARLQARHDVELTKKDLINKTLDLLAQDGFFCVLYPVSEWVQWQKEVAETPLHNEMTIHIFPNKNKAANRVIGIYSFRKEAPSIASSLVIYEERNIYSPAFIALLKEYYLHL